MPIRINRPAFEKLVAEALDGLPDEYARAVKNVAILVRESPTIDDLLSVGLGPEHDTLLGLYQGVPLPERGPDAPLLPDRIVIYRQPILRECTTREQVVAEVRTTVIHELGHYIGLDEDELPR
jgi:predicted Zn-dependent protease with MMP-like domain